MGCLLKNEKKNLKSLIEKAIANGLSEELKQTASFDQHKMLGQLHGTLLEFVLHLEKLLIEHMEETEFNKDNEEQLTNALKKVDLQSFDVKTLWLSLQQVKDKLENKHQEASPIAPSNPVQKLLFEQLLKNWKPENNDPIN